MIRLATADDVDAVLGLWRAADAAPSATDDRDGVLGAVRAQVLLVAEVDGQVVGSLIAAFDGWRGNLYRLAVAPTHRRRGVGRALVAEGERRLRVAGCRRMSALVLRDEVAAVAFWAAVGYEKADEIRRHVKTVPVKG